VEFDCAFAHAGHQAVAILRGCDGGGCSRTDTDLAAPVEVHDGGVTAAVMAGARVARVAAAGVAGEAAGMA